VTVLADRGFGDQVLDELLDTWGWSYVNRFRGAIRVEYEGGSRNPRPTGSLRLAARAGSTTLASPPTTRASAPS
jgi:hypothetical protein